MSRVNSLSVTIYQDVTGKPYVHIEGCVDDGRKTTSASAVDIKIWADEVDLQDHRRN